MMDARLVAVATPHQLRILEAIEQYGNQRAAAEILGISRGTVSDAVASMKRKAGVDEDKEPERVGKRILVIPDVQAKPGIDFSYLRRIGMYAVEKRPDRIVCGGDWADMPSLSSYDKGKKAFEGRRYKRDIEAAQFAMQAFLGPIEEYNKAAKKPYKPQMDLFLGNHEARISRATNDDPMLDGMLSINDLAYAEYGWKVHQFLEVGMIEGVAFSHYFTSGVMGRPVTSAQALLTKKHQSCIAFHQQGLQIATGYRADGALLTAVIAGSCYEHAEEYLGPQGNNHWRGFLVLNDVRDGQFDLMPVSLDYINRKYAGVTYQTPAYSMPTEAEMQAGRM
jgi:hypothetical protein